jgi:hypothetical protein
VISNAGHTSSRLGKNKARQSNVLLLSVLQYGQEIVCMRLKSLRIALNSVLQSTQAVTAAVECDNHQPCNERRLSTVTMNADVVQSK